MFDSRCVLREREKNKKGKGERIRRAREWENWLRVVNVLVPLTGGHSVFYLNYSIIYIKVTGIFLRFIIRDNNVLPLSHSCTILFLFTTSSSYVLFSLFFGDLFHRHLVLVVSPIYTLFQPRFFSPSSSRYIYIYIDKDRTCIIRINLKRHKLSARGVKSRSRIY